MPPWMCMYVCICKYSCFLNDRHFKAIGLDTHMHIISSERYQSTELAYRSRVLYDEVFFLMYFHYNEKNVPTSMTRYFC